MSNIIQSFDYAQYDYATENYAAGLEHDGAGFQFRGMIDNGTKNVGIQTTGRIDSQSNSGLQFAGVITNDKNTGIQFKGFILDATKNIGLQWRQQITVEQNRGFQFTGSITQEPVRGLQFLGSNPGLGYSGFQFLAVNTIENSKGLQFKGSIDKETPTGIQFLGRNDVSRFLGLQFSAKITSENTSGIQFKGIVDGALRTSGVQWKQQITNENSKGFQFRSLLLSGPLTSGFEFRASKSWAHYHCSPGYANVDYATEPYAVDSICATGGIQFKGANTTNKNTGIQWKQRIDTSRITGVQFKGVITQEPISGFQFSAVQGKNVGFQFRVVIYNTTNLRILVNFPSRGTTGTNWTASSTATSSTSGFSANNVNTDIVEQAWRSANTPGSAILTCDTQITQGVFLDTLAILNHNFTGNTTVQLERSTNGITWDLESALTVETENMYYIAPSLPLSAYRYWRIVMNDSTAQFFQIGTVVFGSSVIFQGECFVDTVKFGKKQFADKVFTEGFTNVSNDRGRKRYLGLEFRNLIFGKSNFQQLRDVFDTAGTLLKALYIPIPEAASRFALFGKLTEIPEETHNYKGVDADYVDVNLNVDESL